MVHAIFLRHFESVSQTKPVFEPNLALSKKKADQRIQVRFGDFFLSSYHVNITSCNLCARAKVQRSQRAKNRTEPFPGKIGRGILNLVALALTVTELFNKVCEVSKERKKERKVVIAVFLVVPF